MSSTDARLQRDPQQVINNLLVQKLEYSDSFYDRILIGEKTSHILLHPEVHANVRVDIQGELSRLDEIISEKSTSASQTEKLNLSYLLSLASKEPSAKILNRIKPRIAELSEAAIEEKSEGQLPLSTDSYRGLVNFLNRIVHIDSIPGLVLTYEGNIRAEWRSSPDERLALEFLNFVDLKFVFFYPDRHDSTKVLRISGSGSVSSFLDDHPRAFEFLQKLSD